MERLEKAGFWGLDTICCEATCAPEDVLYEGSDDEDYDCPTSRRERYEAAGQRVLNGQIPLLVSATLKGPFHAESGWVNPWRSKRRTGNRQSPQKFRSPMKHKRTTSIAETQFPLHDSLECHLPSPESLKQAPVDQKHPFLERDELDMVQRWRNNVHPLPREEFWATTSRASLSVRKRKATGSDWLKKLASKRQRTEPLESRFVDTPAKYSNQEVEASTSFRSVPDFPSSTTTARTFQGYESATRIKTADDMKSSLHLSFTSAPSRMESPKRVIKKEALDDPKEDLVARAAVTLSSPQSQSQRSQTPQKSSLRRLQDQSLDQPSDLTGDIEESANDDFQTQQDESFLFRMRPKLPKLEPLDSEAESWSGLSDGDQGSEASHELAEADMNDTKPVAAELMDDAENEPSSDLSSLASDDVTVPSFTNEQGMGLGSDASTASDSSEASETDSEEVPENDTVEVQDPDCISAVGSSNVDDTIKLQAANSTIPDEDSDEASSEELSDLGTDDDMLEPRTAESQKTNSIPIVKYSSVENATKLQVANSTVPSEDSTEASSEELSDLDSDEEMLEPQTAEPQETSSRLMVQSSSVEGATEPQIADDTISDEDTVEGTPKGLGHDIDADSEEAHENDTITVHSPGYVSVVDYSSIKDTTGPQMADGTLTEENAVEADEDSIETSSEDSPKAQAFDGDSVLGEEAVTDAIHAQTMHCNSTVPNEGKEFKEKTHRSILDVSAKPIPLKASKNPASQSTAEMDAPSSPALKQNPDTTKSSQLGTKASISLHSPIKPSPMEPSLPSLPNQPSFNLLKSSVKRLVPQSSWAKLNLTRHVNSSPVRATSLPHGFGHLLNEVSSSSPPAPSFRPQAASQPVSLDGLLKEAPYSPATRPCHQPSQPTDSQLTPTKSIVQSTPKQVSSTPLKDTDQAVPPQHVSASQQSPWAGGELSQIALRDMHMLPPNACLDTPLKANNEAQTPSANQLVKLPMAPPDITPSKMVASHPPSQSQPAWAKTPARPSTPEPPQFSVKSFASFMSPSPERRPANKRAAWRDSGSRLPSTQGILASATKNPWENNNYSGVSQRRVSWAPLPHEVSSPFSFSSSKQQHHQQWSAARERPVSPPPATPIADLPVSEDAKFHHHFTAVARRSGRGIRDNSNNRHQRRRLLSTASQLSLASPAPLAMAETFLAADDVLRQPSPSSSPSRKAAADDIRPDQVTLPESQEPIDIVEDVMREMGDFLGTWDVDTELDLARKDNVQMPQLNQQSPW